MLSGGSEYGGVGAVDPSMNDPKHYRVEYFRRRIRQQLFAVQLGLTGGEDHLPPKATPTTPITTSATTTPSGSQPAEKKGVFAIAKGDDKKKVDEVYFAVRKVIETIESPGTSDHADFYELAKDLRKPMKSLEGVAGKRVPAAGAAAAGVTVSDDAPSMTTPTGKGPAGKTGPAKTGPGKTAPVLPKRPMPGGKAAMRTPPPRSPAKPQPNVFGQPRFSR